MAKGTVADSKKEKETEKPSILHPPYFQMISEAISTLKERTGSSQPAISKLIEEKYGSKSLPPNFRKMLSVQLKKFVKSEKLVKIKNSYKISPTEKPKVTPNSTLNKNEAAKKVSEKAKKTKRLSQVKTPEALLKKKKKKKVLVSEKAKKNDVENRKMKSLNSVKTPEGLKKKLTPMKRKVSNSLKPVVKTKKARK